MPEAKNGDTVKVHYTGTLEDGTEFDSSRDGDPLEFTLGAQQVIPGFEQGVLGMNPSDTKTIHIPCDEAYGPQRKDMIAVVARDQLPQDLSPEIGQQLSLQLENDRTLIVRIADINDEQVTLDANHPLAGETLTFDIELMEIV